MNGIVNHRKTALEIVRVLHENEVPISLMQFVFEEAERLARAHTIPYEPSEEEIRDAVSCKEQ